jgi:hypothetical protein
MQATSETWCMLSWTLRTRLLRQVRVATNLLALSKVVLPIPGVRAEAEGFSLPRSFLRSFILSSITHPPHISHLITYSTTYSTTVFSAGSTI